MRTPSDKPAEGIALGPCQICEQLNNKFYLCNQNHSTCEDCKITRNETTLPSVDSEAKKQVRSSRDETPPLSPQHLETSSNRLSPTRTSSRRSRSPSNDPPSIFSSRSPIKSLVTIPKVGKTESEQPSLKLEELLMNEAPKFSKGKNLSPPVIVEEDCSDTERVFCVACGGFVEVTRMTLPLNMLKCLVPKQSVTIDSDEAYDDATSFVPTTSMELYDEEGLRKDVDALRIGLATTYSELISTRSDLDEVMYTTEKLELDVDMLKGGVNYVYFNFDTVLKRGEIRTEERICGIPFMLMVRIRNVAQVPHLGFFIGLEPHEGRSHSPLKKIIVFRAHNAYGKVIEKHALETFREGQCNHPCFDVTKRQDGSLFGYANFLKRDRILKPDMLKDGILCLSLQIKPLL